MVKKYDKYRKFMFSLCIAFFCFHSMQTLSAGTLSISNLSFNGVDFGKVSFDWESASDDQKLYFLSYKYQVFASNDNSIVSSVSNFTSQSVGIVGNPLVYPNPVRLADGSEIGYELSTNSDVTLKIYDMRAAEVYSELFESGTLGGSAAYNKIPINRETFGFVEIKTGVYFFLLISENEVIGKGKFVVRP